LLNAWEPPEGAGEPIGIVTSTFTFDASFFEEELLARFLALETSIHDGRAWLVEREQRLGEAGAVVLADRRHVSRSSTLAWDLLAVPMRGGTCQHAKVTLLAWSQHVRAIVGSANLSEAAYRRNIEVFAVLDFHSGGEAPISVLSELIAFLKRMVARVPDPIDADANLQRTPRRRAEALLSSIESLAQRLNLPSSWRRGATTVAPVLLEPGDGPGVLDQVKAIWGERAQPSEVWLQAPFWPDSAEGCTKLADALSQAMAARGERELHLFAPGAHDPIGDSWRIEIPEALPVTARRDGRCRVVFHPVRAMQDDDHRPLHAKLSRWRRPGRPEVLLLGSSNASLAGLGVGAAPRNIEANLCFVAGDEHGTQRWFEQCFPSAPELDDAQCASETVERSDDEGGALPLPHFFRWACAWIADGHCTLRIGLGPEGEPGTWTITDRAGRVSVDHTQFRAKGSPTEWCIEFAFDPAKDVAPSDLEVRWSASGSSHLGHLPVNAIDDDSRSRPDLWSELDLETLLQLLASGGRLHRAFSVERRGPTRSDRALDPLGRFDSSQLLMTRIRRISRAIEGLQERLAAPVASESALEWRLRGPLSPRYLAEALKNHVSAPSDLRFLMAEIALAVGRASRSVRGVGVDDAEVEARYQAAISDLRELAAKDAHASDPSLDEYITRAFRRALEPA